MASRFSVVWNSLQSSRYKQSKYIVDYSTLHLYADFPKVKAQCSCGRVADVSETYICVDCNEIRCDYCAETNFSLYHCSKCSKVNESSVTLIHPRTCTNCNECPKCGTLLRNDVGKIDRAGSYYFYSCPFCKWNSIRCSVTSKKPNELFNQAEEYIKKNLDHRKKDLDNFLNMRQLDFLFSSSYYDAEVSPMTPGFEHLLLLEDRQAARQEAGREGACQRRPHFPGLQDGAQAGLLELQALSAPGGRPRPRQPEPDQELPPHQAARASPQALQVRRADPQVQRFVVYRDYL